MAATLGLFTTTGEELFAGTMRYAFLSDPTTTA